MGILGLFRGHGLRLVAREPPRPPRSRLRGREVALVEGGGARLLLSSLSRSGRLPGSLGLSLRLRRRGGPQRPGHPRRGPLPGEPGQPLDRRRPPGDLGPGRRRRLEGVEEARPLGPPGRGSRRRRVGEGRGRPLAGEPEGGREAEGVGAGVAGGGGAGGEGKREAGGREGAAEEELNFFVPQVFDHGTFTLPGAGSMIVFVDTILQLSVLSYLSGSKMGLLRAWIGGKLERRRIGTRGKAKGASERERERDFLYLFSIFISFFLLRNLKKKKHLHFSLHHSPAIAASRSEWSTSSRTIPE